MVALELVEQRCAHASTSGPCLHLRSAARVQLPPSQLALRKGKARSEDNSSYEGGKRLRASHFRYSPICMWPKSCEGIHHILSIPPPSHAAPPSTELKAWMDERAIVYMVKSGGLGKVVCLNFDGDAPVASYQSATDLVSVSKPRRLRGHSPRQTSDPEHTRQISPEREPWDYAVYNPEEAKASVFEPTWDLDGIPDAEQLDVDILESWFDSLGTSRDLGMII